VLGLLSLEMVPGCSAEPSDRARGNRQDLKYTIQTISRGPCQPQLLCDSVIFLRTLKTMRHCSYLFFTSN